jgi:hypothetical protein
VAVPNPDPPIIGDFTPSGFIIGEVESPPSLEQVGITESVSVMMGQEVIPDTDELGVTEDIQVVMALAHGPAIDEVGIEEAVYDLMGRLEVSTDPVGIEEAVSVAMGLSLAPTTDQVGITESIHTFILQEGATDIEEHIGIEETVHAKVYRDIDIIPPPTPGGVAAAGAAGSSTGGWQAKPAWVRKIKLTPAQKRMNAIRKQWIPTLRQQYQMIPILVPAEQKPQVETVPVRPQLVYPTEQPIIPREIESRPQTDQGGIGESVYCTVTSELTQIAPDQALEASQRAEDLAQIDTPVRVSACTSSASSSNVSIVVVVLVQWYPLAPL